MKLPWACRLVYAYVIYRSELSETQNACMDGLRAISRALGMDRRNVRHAIEQLVVAGYLQKGDGDPTVLWLRQPPDGAGVICPGPRGLSVREGGGNLSGKKEVVIKSGYKNHAKVVSGEKLTKLTAEQLKDDAELAGLYLRAVRLGLVVDSGQDRLRFWRAACFALRTGENPPALFAWTVNGQHWERGADEDEATALARLTVQRHTSLNYS